MYTSAVFVLLTDIYGTPSHALKVLQPGVHWSYQTLLAMAAQPELLRLQAMATGGSGGGGGGCIDELRSQLEGRFHAAEMEGVPVILFVGAAGNGGSKSIALRRLPSEPALPLLQVRRHRGQGAHVHDPSSELYCLTDYNLRHAQA